ncbi:MAG: integrase [Arcobacteraceae bacterium]|jgi:integrase
MYIHGISLRGSINNQVNQLWYQVDGIGESKALSRSNSTYKGHNGHKMSDQVHSFKSKDEFIRISKELAKYAKENFKIKDMQAITKDVISSYINNKIEDGLFRRTISSYVSVLSKIQLGLSKIPQKQEAHKSLYSQKDLKEIRKTVDKLAIKSVHINRAYINPNSFKSDISIKSSIGYKLQLEYGLRVNEATLIRSNQLLKDNVLRVQGKGGYQRDVCLSSNLYNQIKQEIKVNSSYHQSYNNYLKDLKNSVLKAGEKWTGTHGLRYNYAQSQMTKYQEKMSYKEALAKVSFELGHHRIEITKHYLK